MNFVFTGGGGSGSWQIRGEQLGEALDVDRLPAEGESAAFSRYSFAVVVKRITERNLSALHACHCPIVWDIVDAWPQPDGNAWSRHAAMQWLREQVRRIKPQAFVAATKVMAKDLEEFNKPVLYLPHHHRPGLTRVNLRKSLRSIGYEGSARHLGAWKPILLAWCARHKVDLRINSFDLSTVDIVVALREVHGYPAKCWKSNVKLANIHAIGLPCVLSEESGYQETANGNELWVHGFDKVMLEQALDSLIPYERRIETSGQSFPVTLSIEEIAERYRAWLCCMKF